MKLDKGVMELILTNGMHLIGNVMYDEVEKIYEVGNPASIVQGSGDGVVQQFGMVGLEAYGIKVKDMLEVPERSVVFAYPADEEFEKGHRENFGSGIVAPVSPRLIT